MEITRGFAEFNNGRFYYEMAGSGHPLVLVHGFSLDHRMWDNQFEEFANRYTVIRYNVRGYGKDATTPTETYTHADDLKAVLSHLGFEHAHVVGLSLGAAISLEYALTYPEATDALVLLDPVVWGYDFLPPENPDRSPWRLGRTEGLEAARAAWLDDPYFRPAFANPRSASRLREIMDDYTGWGWTSPDPGTYPGPTTITRLHEITAPTLVLVGSLDVPDMQNTTDILACEVRGARKVVIEGAGHMSNMEEPEAVNAAILDFLQTLDRPAR